MKSSIYTGNGDTGFTKLADNTKIGKDSLRLDAYGTIDEAGANIALAITAVKDKKLLQILTFVTHKLFNCSSNLAFSSGSDENVPKLRDEDVKFIENSIDYLDSKSGPIQGFVLCGGADASEAATRLHVARTVIRRAERFIIKLDKIENNVDKT
ncbi:MAG: cob(I)yrinic acid a,c-diamide adenosyltransferase, partial [Deltaproteobacteria bacterium]|nr:cob(I)yrinic acid a,c-diamide adenosyltransferase [Deltaproteobacteria bacterium]